ncbi:MAG: pyridoxal phosphate-dependent aminotransferase family protein [Leptospiraceae bacterium]|nr:pyridoxal phosphate-dependent aminotransferase family protein [Leptospiraceae bacterium]
MRLEEHIGKRLEELEKKNRIRFLKEPKGIDFSSNDYLGLAKNEKLIREFQKGLEIYGLGSTASRLISGHRKIYEEVERKFADWVGGENSLFLANGYLANSGLMELLLKQDFEIYSDRLNHASIQSELLKAKKNVQFYKHLDLEDLENKLLKNKNSTRTKFVVSETVFSMDGDVLDLRRLIELKNKYDFHIVLDEAHALGVFGKQGAGISREEKIPERYLKEIDIRVFTAGKALGLEGAFIVTTDLMKKFLLNKLSTFIYSTAPMPAICYTVNTAIDIIKGMNEERKRILTNSEYLRSELQKKELSTLQSRSQIIPIIFNDEYEVMKIARELQDKGFDIKGIRPPTVKQSRLRIIINSRISRDDISKLIENFS